GDIQMQQDDEQIYHEYIAITPLLFHDNPKQVLIIGGGDGLVLHQALKDPRVQNVTLVDIDQVIVNASMTHLKTLNKGSWDDPRSIILIQDAL
ncbi:polyamine aminopropyltransferase, partial [Vibrio vulnificus]|nr:polyamine aminopropyltransferase [Vibrio vulnificus]